MKVISDDELWEIWNEKFSEEIFLMDFMKIAHEVINALGKSPNEPR